MKYAKETPRLTIRFFNADTEEELFQIERNWTNVGEVFTNHMVTMLAQQEFKKKNKKPPKNILVMLSDEFKQIPE